jgi:hypothetical protein
MSEISSKWSEESESSHRKTLINLVIDFISSRGCQVSNPISSCRHPDANGPFVNILPPISDRCTILRITSLVESFLDNSNKFFPTIRYCRLNPAPLLLKAILKLTKSYRRRLTPYIDYLLFIIARWVSVDIE